MSEPTRESGVRYPLGAGDDGAELELDLDGASGSWRGAMPSRVGDGPNSKTLDPEAANIDPEMLKSVKTAALAPISQRPAEVAVVGQPAAPTPFANAGQSSGWETVALTPPLEMMPPQKSEVASVSGAVPRASGSVSAMRPMHTSNSAIRALTASGETIKAPYERAQDQNRKQMIFIGIGAGFAILVGLLFLALIDVI